MTEQTRFPDNLKPTPILDWETAPLRAVATDIRGSHADDRAFLQAAHAHLARSVHPIYSLDELQPASVTLQKRRGSCSQRMACLEATARAAHIPTRVRALRVSGQFWYPRFRAVMLFLPKQILLLWPQFFVDNAWGDAEEIYAPLPQLAQAAQHGFRNDGESVFDAIEHTPIDFFAKTCGVGCSASKFDLSRFVLADEGFFASRDDAFQRLGLLQNTLRGRAFEILFGGKKSREQ